MRHTMNAMIMTIFSGEQKTAQENKEWKGSNENGVFKPDDISEANRTQTYSYVVTPSGFLKGYDPKTGIVTVWSRDMPNMEGAKSNFHSNSENILVNVWELLKRLFK